MKTPRRFRRPDVQPSKLSIETNGAVGYSFSWGHFCRMGAAHKREGNYAVMTGAVTHSLDVLMIPRS